MSDRLSPKFEWEISNINEFRGAIRRMEAATDDFRIPFSLIANDFYRGQKKLLTLKSAGLYEDLSTKPFRAFWPNKLGYGAKYIGGYKEYKAINTGFVYPILLGKTGRLQGSLINRNAPGAVFFIGKQQLVMGTNVPYAIYHQSDAPRKKIPQRKVVFIDGGPADKAKDSSIAGRRERWLNIINDYIIQVVTGDAKLGSGGIE